MAFNRAAGRNSKFHDRNPELHACCEESDHTRQRGSKNPGRSSPRVLISIVERELLQSFSQLGPVWLRLARKKAPSARRNGVARSKGVLRHRAFARRPEHAFRKSPKAGSALRRSPQRLRLHKPCHDVRTPRKKKRTKRSTRARKEACHLRSARFDLSAGLLAVGQQHYLSVNTCRHYSLLDPREDLFF